MIPIVFRPAKYTLVPAKKKLPPGAMMRLFMKEILVIEFKILYFIKEVLLLLFFQEKKITSLAL